MAPLWIFVAVGYLLLYAFATVQTELPLLNRITMWFILQIEVQITYNPKETTTWISKSFTQHSLCTVCSGLTWHSYYRSYRTSGFIPMLTEVHGFQPPLEKYYSTCIHACLSIQRAQWCSRLRLQCIHCLACSLSTYAQVLTYLTTRTEYGHHSSFPPHVQPVQDCPGGIYFNGSWPGEPQNLDGSSKVLVPNYRASHAVGPNSTPVRFDGLASQWGPRLLSLRTLEWGGSGCERCQCRPHGHGLRT